MKTVIERTPATVSLIQAAHDRFRQDFIDCIAGNLRAELALENFHGRAFMKNWSELLKRMKHPSSIDYAKMIRRDVKANYLQACEILGLQGKAA